MADPHVALPHVVIIGCGFGGLEATKVLDGAPVRITLIDRSNHHLFQPLLYQVATAGLTAPSIASPIRHMRRHQRNLTVLMADVDAIDVQAREVVLGDGQRLRYDHLIAAAGATHSYFGNDQWQAHAPGLKTLADAFQLRARLLSAFERAETALDPAERRRLLTLAVVGGGPTGVEMAGAIAELAKMALAEDFSAIDPRQARIAELRFFAGLTAEETAEVLRVSLRTVELDWSMAKSWLASRLA